MKSYSSVLQLFQIKEDNVSKKHITKNTHCWFHALRFNFVFRSICTIVIFNIRFLQPCYCRHILLYPAFSIKRDILIWICLFVCLSFCLSFCSSVTLLFPNHISESPIIYIKNLYCVWNRKGKSEGYNSYKVSNSFIL